MNQVQLAANGLIIAATFGLSANLEILSNLDTFRKKCNNITFFGDRQVCTIETVMGPMSNAEYYTVIKFCHIGLLEYSFSGRV